MKGMRAILSLVTVLAVITHGLGPADAQPSPPQNDLSSQLVPLDGNDPRSIDLQVHFLLGSDQLTDQAKEILFDLKGVLASPAFENTTVEIIGHTDASGSAEKNQVLSEKRALSVVRFLIKNGIEEDRVTAAGRGEQQLLVDLLPNDPLQRRVEVVVTKQPEANKIQSGATQPL